VAGAAGAGPQGVEAGLQDAEVIGVGEGEDDDLVVEAEVGGDACDDQVRGDAGDDEDLAVVGEGAAQLRGGAPELPPVLHGGLAGVVGAGGSDGALEVVEGAGEAEGVGVGAGGEVDDVAGGSLLGVAGEVATDEEGADDGGGGGVVGDDLRVLLRGEDEAVVAGGDAHEAEAGVAGEGARGGEVEGVEAGGDGGDGAAVEVVGAGAGAADPVDDRDVDGGVAGPGVGAPGVGDGVAGGDDRCEGGGAAGVLGDRFGAHVAGALAGAQGVGRG
jgi:hypothetical protein